MIKHHHAIDMSRQSKKEPHDFWIGDRVKIRSTGNIGKVESEERDGYLKIKIENTQEYIKVKADEIEKAEEKKIPKSVKILEEKTNLKESVYFNPEIDLHLDKLGNYHTGVWKADELSYQEQQCRKFLNKALSLRIKKVLIIHGKGEGVLKSCVEALLHNMIEVDHTVLVNNGGATEVWFRY